MTLPADQEATFGWDLTDYTECCPRCERELVDGECTHCEPEATVVIELSTYRARVYLDAMMQAAEWLDEGPTMDRVMELRSLLNSALKEAE